MDRNELKEKTKVLKAKYLPVREETLLTRIKDTQALLLKIDGCSEEEIKEKLAQIKLSGPQKGELEKAYYLKNFAHHSTSTAFGFDLESVCGDMRTFEYEEIRFLAFDKNYRYLGLAKGTGERSGGVHSQIVRSVLGEFLQNYPACRYAVSVHNHDKCAAAIPSTNDGVAAFRLKNALRMCGIRLYDDCIFSVLDFYSRRQEEENGKKENGILITAPGLNEETLQMIGEENRFIAKAIKDQ